MGPCTCPSLLLVWMLLCSVGYFCNFVKFLLQATSRSGSLCTLDTTDSAFFAHIAGPDPVFFASFAVKSLPLKTLQ
jgi:hypothetical protein